MEYALRNKGQEAGGLDDDGLDDIMDIADRIGTGRSRASQDSGSQSSPEFTDVQTVVGGYSNTDNTLDAESNAPTGESVSIPGNPDGQNQGGASAKSASSSLGHEPAGPQEISERSENARYIPPHLRASVHTATSAREESKSADRLKLNRKIHGLLNRLSELNLDRILTGIEEAYQKSSRHDVSESITLAILEMIASQITLLESFVILYATLITAVRQIIGNEFGASFLHSLMSRYQMAIAPSLNDNYHHEGDAASSFRESMNLLALIGELYNAQMFSANLIFDLVRQFLGPPDRILHEQHVEGLLRLLRACGGHLRSDDPQNLKDIARSLVQRFSGREKHVSARTAFMIEMVQGLQSGKSKTSRTDIDGVARMKKYLSNLGRDRRLLAIEPLRVSLSDLLNADTRGRWWLVGAGWTGDPLREHQAISTRPEQLDSIEQERLNAAAKKQGFNTEVRRAIFAILMTSDDCHHACERLTATKMTETQQREYVRVTLQCCGSESEYNPYYTLILQHFCTASTSHRFTLQYALWDFFRELGEDISLEKSSSSQPESHSVPKTRLTNIARATAFLIARTSLDLTILKVLDFTLLQNRTISFLRWLFASVFIGLQTSSALFLLPKTFDQRPPDQGVIQDIFTSVLSNLELVQGLNYFLRKYCTGEAFAAIASQYGMRAEEVVRCSVDIAIEILQ